MFMNKLLILLALVVPSPIGVDVVTDAPPMPVPIEEPAFTAKDVDCMAKNIYFEASGEDMTGKLSAGFIPLNRAQSNSREFPNTVCEVIYKKNRGVCQFSWVCQRTNHVPILRNAMDHQAWAESQWAARAVLAGEVEDPTRGATHYYNPKKASPVWRHSLELVGDIGSHRFMKLKN